MTISFGKRSAASKPTIVCSDCGVSYFLHSLVYDGLCTHVKETYPTEAELVAAAERFGRPPDEAR